MPNPSDRKPKHSQCGAERFNSLADVHTFLAETTDFEKMRRYMMKRGPFDLGRVERFGEALNAPQTTYECAHIAGTKGKGSTSIYLDTICRAHGVITGRFTSPHLERLNERITLNGNEIDDIGIVATFNKMWSVLERFQRSGDAQTFFEIITLAAMVAFREAGVDLAVLETGLGGRLDSTNIVMPAITIITSIGHDHHDKLGDTLEDIAYEKGGIIKPDTPLVLGESPPEALAYLLSRARDLDAPVTRLSKDFEVRNIQHTRHGLEFTYWGKRGPRMENLEIPALGAYQASNAALAIEAYLRLSQIDVVPNLNEGTLRAALYDCQVPGRCEYFGPSAERCGVLLDVAHNPESVEQTVKVLRQRFAGKRVVGVLAIASDKEREPMLATLGRALDDVVITSFGGPRATPVDELHALWRKYGRKEESAQTLDDPKDALDAALSLAGREGLVCIVGSFYLAGVLRQRVRTE